MTETFIALSCRRGDAPGYIREGLAALATIVEPICNSDFYRTRFGSHGEPDLYSAAAVVETKLSSERLSQHLKKIERSFRSALDVAESAQPLSVEPIVSSCWQAAALVPLHDLRPLALLRPDGTPMAAALAALPADEVARMTRIPHTAQLVRPAVVDYDAPGGAAAGYDELRPLSQFDIKVFTALARLISLDTGMRVLDVGCGTGRFSRLLTERGARVTGFDKSATMLSAARAAAPPAHGNLEYVKGDANSELPPGPFDVATFFFSAQYMEFTPHFWETLARVLRPNGTIAFATFPHRHFAETDLTRYFPGVPAIDWARFPSFPALIEKLRRHSWRAIAIEEIVHHDTAPVAEYFTRVERKYISSLHLMSAQEFAAGLATMRAKNAGSDTVARTIQATIVCGSRVRTPQGKASPATAAKEHAVADSNKESSLARFIRDQVDPISAAFSQTPLTRLRIKTSRGAVTLVKVPPSANGVPQSTEDDSEGARAPEKLPHAARLHNPEAGRAYDTISADVVGIFRELPEPPATGERLTNGQVLGHIEALRLRNTVVCPVDCTLIAQVVDDGQPVDFGETLFVVDSGGVPLERESEALPEAEAAQALEPVEPPRL